MYASNGMIESWAYPLDPAAADLSESCTLTKTHEMKVPSGASIVTTHCITIE